MLYKSPWLCYDTVKVIFMHIWKMKKWITVLDYDKRSYRSGLRLKFDKGIDPELKEECKRFAAWLRNEYIFPVRVPIYFKNYVKLRCIDGATASAAFFRPDSYFDEPYIRIAVGDYRELCEDWGEIEALFAVLRDIAHELTHYFQWINRLELTAVGEERQATNYSRRIVNDEYQEVWESEHIEKVEDWYRSHNVNDDR